MGTRSSYVGERLRSSYWLIPALMTLGAAVLSFVTLAIDDSSDLEQVGWLHPLVFSGETDGAREVLGTIAASMITVAGVVFSITIVSLQLASTQFGPRMLANFMRDRGNQVTLGTFLAAFLYSLLVLRTLPASGSETVPHLSVTVALGLAVAGVSVLIYFIHHIATAIQAPTLVDAISGELREGIDTLFPYADEVDNADEVEETPLPEGFEENAAVVDARSTGYVQVVEIEDLVALAREHDLVVRLAIRPGRFVVHHTPFAHAYPAERVSDEVKAKIAATVETAARRAPVQDIEFPIRQMVEIAVRALSPAINDPFTASTCVDQISAALCLVAARDLPKPHLVDQDGALRVVVGDPVTFGRLVSVGYNQIRQAASFHVAVYIHLLDSITRIIGCVVDGRRLEPLLEQARLVVEAAERHIEAETDMVVVSQRYDALLDAVSVRRP